MKNRMKKNLINMNMVTKKDRMKKNLIKKNHKQILLNANNTTTKATSGQPRLMEANHATSIQV